MNGKVKNVKITTGQVMFDAPNGKQYFVKKEGMFCNVYEWNENWSWKYITSLKIEDKVTAQKVWEKLQI